MSIEFDSSPDELEEEFQKLASLVPTIPSDVCLTELEFLEIVIDYIQELQELLSPHQWNECFQHLSQSMKTSFISLPTTPNSRSLCRNPLQTIHLDTNRPE